MPEVGSIARAAAVIGGRNALPMAGLIILGGLMVFHAVPPANERWVDMAVGALLMALKPDPQPGA